MFLAMLGDEEVEVRDLFSSGTKLFGHRVCKDGCFIKHEIWILIQRDDLLLCFDRMIYRTDNFLDFAAEWRRLCGFKRPRVLI